MHQARRKQHWLIFNSTIVLWVSQNIEDDYTYNLAL